MKIKTPHYKIKIKAKVRIFVLFDKNLTIFPVSYGNYVPQ